MIMGQTKLCMTLWQEFLNFKQLVANLQSLVEFKDGRVVCE